MEERRTKFYSSCRDGHIEIVSLYYQFYDMMFDLRVSRSFVQYGCDNVLHHKTFAP